MVTEIVNLSQIKINEANPRIITDEKFRQLVNSILVFPKMLELRPIVVGSIMEAIGGNMRYRALQAIKIMYPDEITERLHESPTFNRKTIAEKQKLVDYWQVWQQNPTAPIVRADKLSEDEKREFIVKDNTGFGTWDYEALANEWDSELLTDWGMDVWESKMDIEEEDEGDTEPKDFKLIVDCKSQEDQLLLISKLDDMGYKYKVK
jgi:hypothetical protein